VVLASIHHPSPRPHPSQTLLLLQVVPSGQGQTLPLYFPLLPTYWRTTPSAASFTHSLVSTPAPDVVQSQTHVELHGLRRVFDTPGGGKRVAVEGLSLSMPAGRVTALLGPNGAGKTTTVHMLTGKTCIVSTPTAGGPDCCVSGLLYNNNVQYHAAAGTHIPYGHTHTCTHHTPYCVLRACMAGMLQPTGGSASIGGADICKDMPAIRRSLGVCPQYDILWPALTVQEHLCLAGAFKGLASRPAVAEAARAAHEVCVCVCVCVRAHAAEHSCCCCCCYRCTSAALGTMLSICACRWACLTSCTVWLESCLGASAASCLWPWPSSETQP
jgi:energy-coupling factor transporter ATP-binding protein EcfA2